MRDLHLLFPREEESWNSFGQRLAETEGQVIAVLAGAEDRLLRDQEELKQFLADAQKIRSRLRFATKHKTFGAAARNQGIRVIDRTRDLRDALVGRPGAEEALRAFSPHIWRQQLRTSLQTMGLLSLPKIRIWFLIALSGSLFLFVFFKLLPSADIRIRPRQDAVNQTANIFLVQSGATVEIPARVRTMPLIPITVHVERSITFDQISKEFIGKSAEALITIVNKSNESYSLRTGTRLLNQAGMIFKTLEPLNIPQGNEIAVRAKAGDLDLYGEIIGERGNVPAGVRWEFPGLAPEERLLIYGENRAETKGGTTSYRTVLSQSDLNVAKKRLEQELLATAKQLVDEERTIRNMGGDGGLEMLYYEELTKTGFKDFVLPTQFLGEAVTSIPVEGKITYTTFAYDAKAILDMLSEELEAHVSEGKELLRETLTMDRMIVHVIGYDDDLRWIKLTVDLTGTEQFVLDPLSPTGARLNKKIRESVAGATREEAFRIVKNLPEVERVQIFVWPPWSRRLPKILSHISITPQDR